MLPAGHGRDGKGERKAKGFQKAVEIGERGFLVAMEDNRGCRTWGNMEAHHDDDYKLANRAIASFL